MNKEFKRMIELAGLTEIKVTKPGGAYILIGPDLQKESTDKIVIMKGQKEPILNYIIDKIAPSVGYEVLNNGIVIDALDGEEMFSNLEKFKEFVWDELIGHGFGFNGEEFTVKEQ